MNEQNLQTYLDAIELAKRDIEEQLRIISLQVIEIKGELQELKDNAGVE